METIRRRQLIAELSRRIAGLGVLCTPFLIWARWVWGKGERIVLPPGTNRESLLLQNPAELDTRNLEITPLEAFGVMGISNPQVDPERWDLEIAGSVETPLKLNYRELLALPVVERNVLLICPGVFANHGRWKGVSIRRLLETARVKDGVTHVTALGPSGPYEKTVAYPMEDVWNDRVFLAYEVNGQSLPVQHGYPIRIVAEGRYGDDWVKYVYKLTAEKNPRD